MTVTTEHPRSSYGVPVIQDDSGNPMDYAEGVKAVRKHLGLNVASLAGECGVSPRTVEGWEQGRRMPDAAALNIMSTLVRRQRHA